MTNKFALSNPDELAATMTITATVAEFRRMREQLKAIPNLDWPLFSLRETVNEVISKASTTFYADKQETKP